MVSDGRYKVKRIWKKLYLGLAILGIAVPLQVKAAGQDTVNLQEENSRVAVSLGMSNAKEEKISTLSISLSVDMGGQNQGEALFDFDAGLEGVAEHDYVYNAGTGRMDIYVSSLQNGSLFGDGELKLGHVRVVPADASAALQVEVGYLEGSFKTANASYGSKTPVISSLPEPVVLQLGAGAPEQPGDGGNGGNGAGSGDGNQSGGGTGGNDGQSHGNDNMSQGLYDEETRFTNNPADAQNIPNSVVRENNLHPELVDLSKGNAAQAGGKTLSGSVGAGAKAAKGNGKVSVVAPEAGPDSILIAGAGKGGAEGIEGEGAGAVGGITGGTSGAGSSGDGTAGDSEASGEIRLDKKNGGAFVEKNSEKTKWIIAGAAAAVLVIVGIAAFVLAGRHSEGGRRRKPARRRRKRPADKRESAARKRPSGKKESMSDKRQGSHAGRKATRPAGKKGSGSQRR